MADYESFPCAKVVCVELPGVGWAAAGVASLEGCSSFTRRDLVQVDDPKREQELFAALQAALEAALREELAKALASERSA